MNIRILAIIVTLSVVLSGVGVVAANEPMPEDSMSFAMSGSYPPFNFVDILASYKALMWIYP